MSEIDRDRVAAHWQTGDNAKSNAERGRALEDLITYLFGVVPGVELYARNAMNAFEAEEIDVAFWNDGHPDGLRFFDPILLVECKNWSTPVGNQELAVFLHKLRSRGRSQGVFVAAHGITGDPASLTAAHSILAQALNESREILVLTREEICALADTDALVRLLKQKRAQLAVSGTVYPDA